MASNEFPSNSVDTITDNDEYPDDLQRQFQAMKDAENHALQSLETKTDTNDECECRDGMFPTRATPNRRNLLLGSAAAIAGSTASGLLHAKAPPGAFEYQVPADPTKVQGRLTHNDDGYGTRSQFSGEVRWRFPTKTQESSWTMTFLAALRVNVLSEPCIIDGPINGEIFRAYMTPLGDSKGIITPSGLHFERHHGGIPTIDPAEHNLIVHGLCDRPKKYSMADLQRFPSTSRIAFIECSGNGLTEFKQPYLKTVQGTHGLTSNSEWTGVPLSTILREVGVKSGAAWILAEGADAAVMTRSVPIDKAMDDALLCYAQNGEAIRPEQGYPLRLLLPGFEGNTHIKWLRRLEISDKPFMTREETSKYTDVLDNGKARQFTLTMDAKSVITFPSGEMKLPGSGFYEISGLAWTGRGAIRKVEITTDGGQNWASAKLQTPVMPMSHTRFRYPWNWDGNPALIASRCIDETGYVQPTIAELNKVRGVNGHPKFASIYHNNGIMAWSINADGSVKNAAHAV